MQQNVLSYYCFRKLRKMFYLIPSNRTQTQRHSHPIFSFCLCFSPPDPEHTSHTNLSPEFVFLSTLLWPNFTYEVSTCVCIPSYPTIHRPQTIFPFLICAPPHPTLITPHTQFSLYYLCSSPPDSDHTSLTNFSSAFVFVPA